MRGDRRAGRQTGARPTSRVGSITHGEPTRPVHEPRLVPLVPRQIADLGELVGHRRFERLTDAARSVRERAGRRIVWHVNSTATGGGVAEMLRALLGYVVDLGIDTRWLVVDGGDDFFALTKRLHNRLHGTPSGPRLSRIDRELYQEVSARNADALVDLVRPGDPVVL